MPRQEYDPEAMDAAAAQAAEALRKRFADAPADQLDGARALVEWLREWYTAAGYKRLCRHLLKESGL